MTAIDETLIAFVFWLIGVASGSILTDLFSKRKQKHYKIDKPFRPIAQQPFFNFKHDLADLVVEYGLNKEEYFELCENITKFRHLSIKEQYDLLDSLNKYPKIRNYLVKIQRRDLC